MKLVKWAEQVQDRSKWKAIVEKAKTLSELQRHGRRKEEEEQEEEEEEDEEDVLYITFSLMYRKYCFNLYIRPSHQYEAQGYTCDRKHYLQLAQDTPRKCRTKLWNRKNEENQSDAQYHFSFFS